MRLLIITQVVDTNHPILGFFHRWIEEFAKKYEHIHVICLQEGEHNFPENVTVHSLGKEKGNSRMGYLVRFYKLIWGLRKDYDDVFVHMNQVYVLLGALIWRSQGKKVGLWYAHGTVTLSLRMAVVLVNFVVTSTKEGLQIQTKKRKLVGQGIDVEAFKPCHSDSLGYLRLVTVGRISQSKNLETLLGACAILNSNDFAFRFKIIGAVSTETEKEYEVKIKKLIIELGLEQKVDWAGAVLQPALPKHLQNSDVFIHDGSTGSLDKVLIEAVLCGCVVTSSNPAYRNVTESVLPDLLFKQGDFKALARIIEKRHTDSEKSSELIRLFKKEFAVTNLIEKITRNYQS